MLRWEEKEDIVERYAEVELAVGKWREYESTIAAPLRDEFTARLLISWIFHDSALEGEVLTYSEIKAATDTNIISDVSLIPAYEDIMAFDTACRLAIEHAGSKKKPIDLELVRSVYATLMPAEVPAGLPYRKENPLHRLYYHDIVPPEKVAAQIKKLGEWLEDADRKDMHPIEFAAGAHKIFMAIFPWAKHSGKVARVLSNVILMRHNYPVAILHSIDRQRYYEALRTDDDKLVSLYLEAVETTAQSAIRVYDEARQLASRRGSRRAS